MGAKSGNGNWRMLQGSVVYVAVWGRNYHRGLIPVGFQGGQVKRLGVGDGYWAGVAPRVVACLLYLLLRAWVVHVEILGFGSAAQSW